MKQIKVLHVNTFECSGGAAKAAKRLHTSLKTKVNSQLLVGIRETHEKNVIGPSAKFINSINLFRTALDGLPGYFDSSKNNYFHTYAWMPTNLSEKINEINPDITHLHWVGAGLIRPEEISKIKSKIVWTLHDAWPLIGAEHLSLNFNYAINGYQNEPPLSFNKLMWKRKQKAWANVDITLISPSTWMAGMAQNSSFFRYKTIATIPNTVSTKQFHGINKIESKKALNINPAKKVILFISMNATRDNNKGLDLLQESLKKLPNRQQYTLLIVGADKEISRSTEGMETVVRKTENSERIINLCYSAADVTAVPSRLESLSYVAIESIFSNTPVVAFNTSGIIDVIKHKKNGYLAKAYNTSDFAQGLNFVLEEKLGNLFFEQRQKTIKYFGEENVSKKHLDLYKNILRDI